MEVEGEASRVMKDDGDARKPRSLGPSPHELKVAAGCYGGAMVDWRAA